MANKGGIVTRKDMFSDDAMNFGKEYHQQLKIAIEANQELVSSVKELNKQVQNFKVANNQKDYITAKQAEALATQRAIDAIKRQETAEISALRIKERTISTLEAERKANLNAELGKNRLKKSTDALTDSQKKLNIAKQNGQKLTPEEIINQRILAKNAQNHALANSKLASEYDKLTAKVRIAATALQNIIIKGREVGETTQEFNARLRQAQNEFDSLQEKVIAANRAIGKFNDNVGNYPEQAASAIQDLVAAFGLVVGVETFVDVTTQAFNIIREFEAEVVNLAAIAGKTREEIAPLEEEIRRVASTSINSATDVAKLATELVKLGSTPEEAAKLLAPINNLSIALKSSAEDSATLVKSLLNSYQEGAEQATHFTDVLAESANRSALDFDGLRDSFSYLAPVAKTLNIPIERTAAIIGTLTDNGIKAESAGRLMASGLGKLSTQGLTLEDALNKINKAQKENKSSMEVLNIANELFGNEAGKLGLILANNVAKIDASTLAYENSSGALQELTDKQLKSINSELEVLSSSWEEYILNTNEASGGTQAMTSVLKFLSSNLKTIIDTVIIAGSVWLAYRASLIVADLQQRLIALTIKASTLAQAENTIATEASAVAQTENAAATTVATTSWQRFNAALKANALFLIIAAITTIIYLYSKVTKSLEENYQGIKKSTDEFLKQKDVANKNATSINNLSDRYDELKSKTKLSVEEQKELNKIIKTLSDTVPGATSKMDKYGNAIEINTAKTRAYVNAKNDMIKAENAVKLDQNIALLKDLRKEQDYLNVSTDKNNGSLIDGIGYIVKMDGVLKKRGGTFRGYLDLTKEEIAIYSKRRFQNEEAIANTIAQINALKGLTEAQKQAIALRNKEAKIKEENGPRTIEIIDAEISAQEELIKKLSDKTGREGNIIKSKIKSLQAERDLIYNNNKASENDDEKRAKKQLDNAKKVRDAIYNLNQFRLSNEIEINQEIIDEDENLIDVRLNSLSEINQLRALKNEETLRYELTNNAIEGKELEKLTEIKRNLYIKSANNRINSIIDGKLATEKMTDEEKLIIEKYYAEKAKLEKKSLENKQNVIDSEVTIVKKKIDDEIAKQENRLNKALEAENKIYMATLNANKNVEEQQLEHERKILEIKRFYAQEGFKTQIKAIEDFLKAQDLLPEKERISSEKRIEIENKLAKIKKEFSDANVENHEKDTKKILLLETENFKKIEEASKELASALQSLANAIFDQKISNIDSEIEKEQAKYNKQLELAGTDEKQKDLIRKEAEKKQDELEKKRRKEQHKQAVFNKVMASVDIGIKTSQAIMGIWAQVPKFDFGVSAGVMTALVSALGAAQLAAVFATPIPKYKIGRKGGPAELAELGDGYVHEVIEKKDGRAFVTPDKPTLMWLDEGDKVYSTVDDYYKLQRASTMASINTQGRKMSSYQAEKEFDKQYGKEILDELKRNTKAIEKQRPIYIENKIDIPHRIWASKNTNWS